MITVVSKMITIATTPIYEKQIDSINEIVNGSFDMIGDGVVVQYLMRQTRVIDFKTKENFWFCCRFMFSLQKSGFARKINQNSNSAVNIKYLSF